MITIDVEQLVALIEAQQDHKTDLWGFGFRRGIERAVAIVRDYCQPAADTASVRGQTQAQLLADLLRRVEALERR